MQQQQIDLGKPQPRQAFPGRSFEIVRRKMGGPDLGTLVVTNTSSRLMPDARNPSPTSRSFS